MRIIGDDGLTVARGLRDPHRARNRGAEHLLREVRTHVLGDLCAEVRPTVVHRQQDRRDRQLGIEVLLDELDVLEQLAQTLERVVLALDGDEDLTGGDEGVDREQTEARRQSMMT